MERYMLHFKNKDYGPEHSREVINKARDLTSDLNVSVRVARIARKFVEFDVAVEKDDLASLIEKLSPIGTMDNIRHVKELLLPYPATRIKEALKLVRNRT